MFPDHPSITATNTEVVPDRLERVQRAGGDVMALADGAGFVGGPTQLHDHEGSEAGDGTSLVEHEC